MNVLMEAKELMGKLDDPGVKVVDCRFLLGSPEHGSSLYKIGHIPGAVYFDLEKDLSGLPGKHGGRHPLPSMEEFAEKLGACGIDRSQTVVAYDTGELAFASRLYWMMKYAGHDEVYILQGGFKTWEEGGYPISAERSVYPSVTYDLSIQDSLLTNYEAVKAFVNGREEFTLIDSRDSIRYEGIEEKIDHAAGHIPGAVNKLWHHSIMDGAFKSGEELKELFRDVNKDQKVVVYCGSGVTAAPNFIALKLAGFKDVSLYAGSFSDYISYSGNRVAGKEGEMKISL
ncbi:sulfurtransferase [Peribacillus sp. SCS-26]|uniref:sulfurtransferase n=1 Tax=Paraperibacillus marinus TaxID=3115295 RepID=UPI0039063815